jgi:hypothetical protein
MTRRALLTDREREIIRGEDEDVEKQYRYETISRVRSRIQERLAADVEALAEHDELLDEVREIVCANGEGTE